MSKVDRYLLYGLWTLVAADAIWFVSSGFEIRPFILFFVLVAAAFAWWGTQFPVTPKMRRNAALGVSGFWTLVFFLLFFPFPVPDQPDYVVGEVHRFSEMEHGWSRALTGALGPNLVNHGRVYTDLNEIAGLGDWGTLPTFVTTFPLTRATFGGTSLLDGFRGIEQHGGEPARPATYPWTNWQGEHREKKIGWNKGDLLLGEVAKQVGYSKAKYTPHENTLMVKSIAKWLGSTEVAVTAMDPRWFYSHDFLSLGTPLPLEEVKDLKYAIQVFTDQNWTRVHNDPGESWWSITKSGAAYSTSAWIAVRLAQMLRDMGYSARVGFGGINYENVESPLSAYGGVGEYGRLSDVVVPTAGGLRYKSASILTDFPLEPPANPKKGFGITRMCEYCDRCARACPVSSIPMGAPTVENGVKIWQVDKDKCVRFRAGNLNGNCCNECLRVCPYNKPDTMFHRLGNYMIRHSYLAPYLFGNVGGVGLEDWLDFEYSSEASPYNVNRPARWVQEEAGFKMPLPYMIGKYIYTEEDRSTAEEWSTGVGAQMGKVGLTYKGIAWGEIPKRFFDAEGRHRNVHWDWEGGELPHDLQLPGKVLTPEEARTLLESGQAFTGGTNHPHDNVYPPRSKYEKGKVSYEEAVRMWQAEK